MSLPSCRHEQGPAAAAERLARMARAIQRLPRLPRLTGKALRYVVAETVKDLATAAAAGGEEWSSLAKRCGRLLNEVGRAAAALELLEATGAPGPHGEAARKLAEILAGDPCVEEMRLKAEELARKLGRMKGS